MYLLLKTTDIFVCEACILHIYGPLAQVKRRSSHEPNRMQIRKTLCSPSLAFDSAHVLRRLTPALRPDYMSRAGPLAGMMSVCRDLGTFVKRNKNQLRDYMTTGPARFSAHRSSPAHVIRPLVRCSALFTINSRSSFHSLRMKCLGL